MMLMSDIQIREAVLRELKWVTSINVAVTDGIVTLTGTVDNCMVSLTAQEATERAAGVFKVVNEIKVNKTETALTDTEIASAVRRALELDMLVPDERVRSTVSNGWVALEGEVDLLHEREDAERIVRRLAGVRGVYNEIVVNQSEARTENVREAIEGTLRQRAQFESDRIHISLADGQVTLSGTVHSWEEERAIIYAASRAPGVQGVNDRLSIET